jgi:hypothetical protein
MKMRVYVYSTIQHNEWACPGSLVTVNENNEVIWTQQNPDNFDDDRNQFDITGFEPVNLVDIYDE